MEKDTTGFEKQDDGGLAEALKAVSAEALPARSVVIFRAPLKHVAQVAQFLQASHKQFDLRGIVALACPDDIEVIVIPAGTPPANAEFKKKESPPHG